MRTVKAYAGMPRDFFSRAGKPPDKVAPQDAFAWAYGVGLSGKQPSSTTTVLRSPGSTLAVLRSLKTVAGRMSPRPLSRS
jgi:hypothetical protein